MSLLSIPGEGPVWNELLENARSRGKNVRDPQQKKDSREALLRAYSNAKRTRTRARIFTRLWLLNARSRQLTALNLVYVSLNIGPQFIHRMNQIGVIRPANALPDVLHMLETKETQTLATLFHTIRDNKKVDLARVVAMTSRDALVTMVTVQVLLATIQTILELRFHDSSQKLQKARLVTLAKRLEITNASKMNMDELRVAIAYKFAEKSDRVRSE